MAKSATDLMQEIIFSAVLDAVVALRTSAKGLPNALWRDVGAVHPNTTMKDLAPEVQAAINESVRTAFAKLRQGGYAVTSGVPEERRGPPRPPRPKPSGPPTVETRRRPQTRTPPRKPPSK